MNADVELTKTFTPEEYARALESWSWLDLSNKEPIFASSFGDVFFSAEDGVWYLDTIEGTLDRTWPDVDALREELATRDGQDHYLLGGLVFGARERGLVLGEGQVYAFELPPVLGGAIAAEKMKTLSFVVAVNLAGQLHDQVRDLPPGSRISGVTLGEEG
jgi:hypothetical protein